MADMIERLVPYLDKQHVLGLMYFLMDQGEDVNDALAAIHEKNALTLEGEPKPGQEEKIAKATARAKPALDEFFEPAADTNYTYQFKLTATEIEQLRLQSELSCGFLEERKGITEGVMQAVLELAYLYYDQMSFGDASELLALCNAVSGYSLATENILWGKLMCDTGATNWTSALDVAATIRRNQNSDDDEVFGQVSATTVRQRACLLHWILFPIFKGGHQYPIQLLYYIFDHKSDRVYKSVVETVCPHYLRYICAASLLNPSRQGSFRDTAKMVRGVHEYSDALTTLVDLISRAAFEAALALLPEVQALIKSDYFLMDFEEDLMNNARRMIFQRYIACHTVVSIQYVADKLGMEKAATEVWLASLISESKQRAKVDSVNGQLIVEPQARPVDAMVYEKLDTASRK